MLPRKVHAYVMAYLISFKIEKLGLGLQEERVMRSIIKVPIEATCDHSVLPFLTLTCYNLFIIHTILIIIHLQAADFFICNLGNALKGYFYPILKGLKPKCLLLRREALYSPVWGRSLFGTGGTLHNTSKLISLLDLSF